jgi:hypothetical protein
LLGAHGHLLFLINYSIIVETRQDTPMLSSNVIFALICLAIATFTGVHIGMDYGVVKGIVAALTWGSIYVVSSKLIVHIKKTLDEIKKEAGEEQKKRNDRENEKAARKAGWPFLSVEEAEVEVATRYANLHLSADEQRRIACLLFYGWVLSDISGLKLTFIREENTKIVLLDCQTEG